MKHKRGQTFVFGEDTERQRATNQQQREKKMVILLKITKVMNLRHISTSAIANLTKPERSGEMLPITGSEYSGH